MAKPDIRSRMSYEVAIDVDSLYWSYLAADALSDPLALLLHLEHEAEINGSTLHTAVAEWFGDTYDHAPLRIR